MSISQRSVGPAGSARRTLAGAVGAGGVAVAMLFGALPSAEASSSVTSGSSAVPATVSTAVTQTAFEVPMAGPVQLADPPVVTGITNTIATDFHTAPMPDWWGHHWWRPWGHHWGHGWGHHWWHPWGHFWWHPWWW